MSLPFVPPGAVITVGASGNVAAGTAAASLAATAGYQNFVTGFQITSSGSTAAAVVDVTLTGLVGGTITYSYTTVAGATLKNDPLIVTFPTPIPATGANVAITLSVPSLGAGNAHTGVAIQGFRVPA